MDSASLVSERDRVSNILATFALALSDKIGEAMRVEHNRSQTSIAALIQIEFAKPGVSIEDLRALIGLSHSATVRIIDQLVADQLVVRQRNLEHDTRQVSLTLTLSGKVLVQKALQARRHVASAVIQSLTVDELGDLSGLMNTLIPKVVSFGIEQETACRLCDLNTCPQDLCPVNICVVDGSLAQTVAPTG
jgi:DNA-binding MarR family transcriptional regulator